MSSNERSFDAIVLGAGLGGLAAGLHLVRAGARVLMMEGRQRVGGRCQTIHAEGCRLPAGTVVIPMGDFLEEFFADFGVPFPVTPTPSRGVYEIHGKNLRTPDRGALRALVTAALPPDHEDAVDELIGAVRRALSWMEPTGSVSLREWVSRFTDDAAVLGAFQALSGAYLATNSYEVSAKAFIRYLRGAAGRAAIGLPQNGWGDLVEPLGSRFEQLGGELWLRTPVRSILVENGRAHGAAARLKGKEVEVRSHVVISNLGPRATVDKIPPGDRDPSYAEEVAAIPSAPGVALYFKHQTEFLPDGGPLLPASAERACFAITPTALVPELGDGDSHWTEVLVTLEDSRTQSMEAIRRASEIAVCDVHRLFPSLEGTPPFKRLAYRGDWPIYRTWPGWEMGPRTPVENLYLVGDGVRRPDQNGTSAAAQSGRLVASQVLERLGGASRE